MAFTYHLNLPPGARDSIVRIARDGSVSATPWDMSRGICSGLVADAWQVVLPTADPARISAALESNSQLIYQTLSLLSRPDVSIHERITALVFGEADLAAAAAAR